MHAFANYAENPEGAELFHDAETAGTAAVAPAVLVSFDFEPSRTIVDVVGGRGGFLAAILGTAPGSGGVVFDSPQGLAGAEGLSGRIEAVGGDFFESVPAGGDLDVRKWIRHDRNDRLALKILRNRRGAMTQGARLLPVETVPTNGDESPSGPFGDLNMLVMNDGRERTEEEFRTLLGEAGFALIELRREAVARYVHSRPPPSPADGRSEIASACGLRVGSGVVRI